MRQLRATRPWFALGVVLLLVCGAGTVAGATAPASPPESAPAPAVDATAALGNITEDGGNLTTGTYYEQTLASDEITVYALDLSRGEAVNLTIHTDADAAFHTEMQVRNPDGALMTTSSFHPTSDSDPTAETRLTFQASTAGVYYVTIAPRDTRYTDPPANTEITYRLRYETRMDRYEANGAFESAPQLSLGTHRDLTLLSATTDAYAIPLTRGESINVTAITSTTSAFGVELRIYDPKGAQLKPGSFYPSKGSLDETEETRLTYQASTTGVHYLLVSPRDTQYTDPPRNGHTRYDLRLGTRTDRFEPNGVLEVAPSIDTGTHRDLTLLSWEQDAYALNLTAGESVNVTTTMAVTSSFSTDVSIYDPNGAEVKVGSYYPRTGELDETAHTRLTYEAQTNGTHYIVVRPRNTEYTHPPLNGDMQYDMRVQTRTDRFEPNGVLRAAPAMKPGTYGNLTLLSWEQDMYAVQADAGDTLNATMTIAADAAFTGELVVRGPDGSRIKYGEYYPPSGELDETAHTNLTYEVRSSGTYYLSVVPRDTEYTNPPLNGQIDYTLALGGDFGGNSPPPVMGETPPNDPNGDGVYEDVNGDGSVNIVDVQTLFIRLDSDAVRNNADAFDVSGDGSINIVDVQALFTQL